MKVMSFNIRSANDPNGHSFDERAPRLKTIVEKYDPDLIGFQEVVPGWMKHIPDDYGEKYEIFHKYRCETTDIEGCSILWRKGRFECIDKGYFWFSDTPGIVSRGWDSIGCHRTCMWAKLRDLKDGTEFHFFNTHFGFSDPCQLDSVKLLLNHFKALKVKTALLTGDFNMFNHSPAYKELTKTLKNINELLDNDLSFTFHGYHPENYVNNTPIDFCFVTPDTVTPVSYKRVDDTIEGKYPSDHYGLLLEMEMHQNIEAMSLNVCASLPGEDEKAIKGRAGTARLNVMRYQVPDIVGLQEVTELTEPTFMKTKHYDMAPQGAKNPVMWRAGFDLKSAELLPLPGGEECTVATFEHLSTGKLFRCFNAHIVAEEQESVALILQKMAENDLPVLLLGSLNLQIGSPAYRVLREQLQDLRWEKARNNIQPTRHGLGQDMVAPAIADYAFCKGLIPVSYATETIKNRFATVTDHDAILVDVAL